MADKRDDLQRIRDAAKGEQVYNEGQEKRAGANPPNETHTRPAAPHGSGGSGETDKGK